MKTNEMGERLKQLRAERDSTWAGMCRKLADLTGQWSDWQMVDGWWWGDANAEAGGSPTLQPCPDYDLNAVHEVEKGLNRIYRMAYGNHLRHTIALHNSQFHEPGDSQSIPEFMATAAQRTEALVRTLEGSNL